MSHKPLRANEISYILEAKLKGVSVHEVLGKVDHKAKIRQLVELAIINGEDNFVYEFDGMKFNISTKAITELQFLHNIDGVAEIASVIEHEIKYRLGSKFTQMRQEIEDETNKWRTA